MAAANVMIRAGVHTGLVITGGDPGLPDIVGETSRIAIQLREYAAGAEVAISADTHHLVAGYFDCASLGEQALPGKAQLVEIHRAIRESGAQTRLDAAPQLTAFTGRQAEIQRLEALWEQAARGRRQLVLLRGEAGKGKSRLLHVLKARLAERQHAIRELRCFPEFSQSPFHPLIAALEDIWGFAPDDSDAQRFDKLARRVETLVPNLATDAVPVLALLLSLPVAAPYRPCEALPQEWKQDATVTLLALLNALAAQQPVLFIVEDLHWVDPSTLELLTQFVKQYRESPVLAVFTARPDFVHPWGDALDWTLNLGPLSRAEAERMAASIGAEISPSMLAQIAERADGVPLFIEELAKIASGGGVADIPATLSDLLAVRLDAMGEAKLIAQVAAVIGREFDLDLLRQVALLDAGTLARGLDVLEHGGLVLPLGATTRQFKHALIQESVYWSQTRPDRQAVHGRIAQVLEGDSHVAANLPELLARHWGAAGEASKAIQCWLAAGRRATARFAHLEALSYFGEGERQLPALASGPDRDRLEFDLVVNWAVSEQMISGYGGERSSELLRRAATLLERGIGQAADVFFLLWSRWEGSGSGSGHREGVRIAEQLLAIAQGSSDRSMLQQGHFALGVSLFWMGEVAQAREHLEQSVRLEDMNAPPTRNCYGQIMIVGAKSYLSWVLWLQGETDRSEALSTESMTLARRYEDLNAQAYALTFAATLRRWQGNADEALRLAEVGRRVAVECNNPVFESVLAATSGWALAIQGDLAAVAPIQQGIDTIRQAYGSATVPLLVLLADVLAHLGRTDDVLPIVEEALALSMEKDDYHFLAELHRIKGLAWAQQANFDAACECFNKAMAVAQTQGTAALELKARRSLEDVRSGALQQ